MEYEEARKTYEEARKIAEKLIEILCELTVLDEETNLTESIEGKELVKILNRLNDKDYERLLEGNSVRINNMKVLKEFKIKVDSKEYELKLINLVNLEEREIEFKNFQESYFKDKEIEILPLIATKNVYVLPVLAALSTILEGLSQNLKEEIRNKLKITFLIEKELIKYSGYIGLPFEYCYKHIVDIKKIKKFLPTLIDIDVYDMKSLLNLMLDRIIINCGISKDFILKQVNYEDLSEYFEKLHIRIGDEDTIKNYVKEERKKYPPRVRSVIFNEKQKYSIIEKLLYILIDFLSKDKGKEEKVLILIVSEPVKDAIINILNKYSLNSKEKGKNIIMASYINIIDENSPKLLQENAPSYLNFLSKYLNLREIVYTIDEYCYPQMMEKIGIECRKFHEEIKASGGSARDYSNYKKGEVRRVLRLLRKDPTKLLETIKNYERGILSKQKETLEAMNNGFAEIQESILEQLRLIL